MNKKVIITILVVIVAALALYILASIFGPTIFAEIRHLHGLR